VESKAGFEANTGVGTQERTWVDQGIEAGAQQAIDATKAGFQAKMAVGTREGIWVDQSIDAGAQRAVDATKAGFEAKIGRTQEWFDLDLDLAFDCRLV